MRERWRRVKLLIDITRPLFLGQFCTMKNISLYSIHIIKTNYIVSKTERVAAMYARVLINVKLLKKRKKD